SLCCRPGRAARHRYGAFIHGLYVGSRRFAPAASAGSHFSVVAPRGIPTWPTLPVLSRLRSRPMPLDSRAIETLSLVSTATVTTILLKKGLRNVWMRGTRPIRPEQKRVVGPAFTLRFVPAREDLATPESWSSPKSTRGAIEAMPEGCVAVVDAMGIT